MLGDVVHKRDFVLFENVLPDNSVRAKPHPVACPEGNLLEIVTVDVNVLEAAREHAFRELLALARRTHNNPRAHFIGRKTAEKRDGSELRVFDKRRANARRVHLAACFFTKISRAADVVAVRVGEEHLFERKTALLNERKRFFRRTPVAAAVDKAAFPAVFKHADIREGVHIKGMRADLI